MNEAALPESTGGDHRREFLLRASAVAMGGGLVAGYGGFAALAGRFLFDAPQEQVWHFVAACDHVALGQSWMYRMPNGARVLITRQVESPQAESFVALSSTCPHLGCQVHWEPQNDRFFCPCHNGAFDRNGQATKGPPAAAKQQLERYPLKVENGLLYMLVPKKTAATQPGNEG